MGLTMQSFSEDSGVHRDSNSQSGSSLGRVRVQFLTLSYIFGSMRCDSWASFLAHNLASPCLGPEPKAKVATSLVSAHMEASMEASLN